MIFARVVENSRAIGLSDAPLLTPKVTVDLPPAPSDASDLRFWRNMLRAASQERGTHRGHVWVHGTVSHAVSWPHSAGTMPFPYIITGILLVVPTSAVLARSSGFRERLGVVASRPAWTWSMDNQNSTTKAAARRVHYLAQRHMLGSWSWHQCPIACIRVVLI